MKIEISVTDLDQFKRLLRLSQNMIRCIEFNTYTNCVGSDIRNRDEYIELRNYLKIVD